MISIVPPELAERTLALCHFRDIATFAWTSRRAYALVYRLSDQYLWRILFLCFPFDDPRLSVCTCTTPPAHPKAVDWRAKLQRRLQAEWITRRDDGDCCECMAVLFECSREAGRALAQFRVGDECVDARRVRGSSNRSGWDNNSLNRCLVLAIGGRAGD